MSTTSLEAQELNDLRQAVLRGEDIPREKRRAVIDSLRRRRAEDIEKATARKDAAAKKKAGTSDEELSAILGI